MSIVPHLAIAAFLLSASAGPAIAKADPSLKAQAKLSQADAQVIALRARPGTVKACEIEKEKGGSGLRYSFDIVSNDKAYEVGVDAMSGAVLENQLESANAD